MTQSKKDPQLKEFSLSSWAVSNRSTVFVLTAIILFAGITSYVTMSREAFPEVVTPEIYVGTPYPGNSPADIEKLITRPIEKEINTITGIDKILSTSVQGYSTIQVKFDFDVTPSDALRKVKDAVDKAKADPEFPTDLPAEPNVFEMNMSEMMPIMNINISGDLSLDQLKEHAEFLEDEIEAIPEISEVDIRGIDEKEVKIDLDVQKMEYSRISFNDVAQAIANENVTISGGDILMDGIRRTVRVKGEFENMKQIEEVIVKQENYEEIRIRDIGTVEFSYEEPLSFAREWGRPVVMVDVKKRAGENLLDASDQIQEIIKEAKENRFPSSLNITVTGDMSDQTRTQVAELENSIIFGVILVVGVLLFFLGTRNAMFVGIAIPMSMMLSFLILSAAGVTLNMMVLFSLVLALGMLVDNGIVVVENIYRLMDEGMGRFKAAKLGVGEVAWPIIASTATTLAAFFPLLIWPGIMGEFMKYLPITLIIVLGSSLFVALVINPVLTSVLMKVEQQKPNAARTWKVVLIMMAIGLLLSLLGHTSSSGLLFAVGNLTIAFGFLGLLNLYFLFPGTVWFQEKLIPWMERKYRSFLQRILNKRNPAKLMFGMVGMFILSIMLMAISQPKVEFFPITEPQYMNIFIEAPIGTDIAKTNEMTKKIEKKVFSILKDPKYNEVVKDTLVDGAVVNDTVNFLVSSVIAQVGNGTSDPAQGPSMANTPHKARIQISFVKYADRRGERSMHVLDRMRKEVKDLPGASVVVDKDQSGPPTGKPINIEISGDDIEGLLVQAEHMKRFINERNIPGIEELKVDIEQGKPELPVIIDRAKARRMNVSTAQIGDAIRTALFGKEVSTYKEGEDDYPIMLRLQNSYRYDPNALMDMLITFRDQSNGQIRQVPISSVAYPKPSSTFSAVKRKDLDRQVTISSNVLSDYNANEVVAQIKSDLAGYDDMDPRFRWEFTGQQEEQAKEMAFLSTALLIAVFLIFLIIVAQFNSSSTPVIILVSVLFSLIGVLLGLVFTGMDFIVIMTMIGIISLAGVVVNNAIVLIDYTNLLRDRRKEELGLGKGDYLPMEEVATAIIEGGKTRLRPVLLTAITTVLGLMPLAIGLNINFVTMFSELDPQVYVGGDNVVFWGPMSWTVIFGLTFATFLTLVVVPAMYLLVTKLRYKVKGVKPALTSQVVEDFRS